MYLIGFGVPALAVASDGGTTPLDWLPTEPVLLGGTRAHALLRRLRGRGLPGRAQLGSPRASATRALAVGLTEGQALRHVIVPQAVRRVGPPLLNDFIALQKDVALIAIIGVTGEAFRVAQIEVAGDFNYTPAHRRRAALPVHHDPDGAPARPLGAREGDA